MKEKRLTDTCQLMRYFFTAISLLLVVSCSDLTTQNSPEKIDLYINHYQQTAVGEGLHLVYLVAEGKDIEAGHWTRWYGKISGFTYKPGYIYHLKVEKETVENPPADGSSIQYSLDKIISKNKISNNAQFSIKLKPTGYADQTSFVTGSENTGFKLLDTIDIACDNLCGELSQKLQNEEQVIGIFEHADSGAYKLTGFEN